MIRKIAWIAVLYGAPALAQERATDKEQRPGTLSGTVVVAGKRAGATTERAVAERAQTAGGVEVVPDTAFKDTPAQHIKDILEYDRQRVGIVGELMARHPFDPYTLLALKAGCDRGERWSFYVEGRNLTNEHYISTVAIVGVAGATDELFNPGTGSAVFAGARVRW